MSGAPALSVVVAAWNGSVALRECVGSLRAQSQAERLEVLVVRNFEADFALGAAGPGTAPGAVPGTALRYPTLVDLPLPTGTSVPALRAAGLSRASAPLIAFLEDQCTCEPGWAAALLAAHAAGHAIVGGPVEQAPGARPLDWAVYFYDYGRFAPPCEAGPVAQVSGINMSFTRSALDQVRESVRAGVFEAEVQAQLARRGYTPHLAPGALVTHRARGSAAAAVGQAFRLARGYAVRRVAGDPAAKRAAFAIGTVVLPAVLGARIVAGVLQKRRRRGALLVSLPWLALLLAAWSAGEAAGYAGFGPRPAAAGG